MGSIASQGRRSAPRGPAEEAAGADRNGPGGEARFRIEDMPLVSELVCARLIPGMNVMVACTSRAPPLSHL